MNKKAPIFKIKKEIPPNKKYSFHHDVDGVDYIQDNTNGYCFIISQLLCDLLNTYEEENKNLKEELNGILSMISLSIGEFKND